MKGIAIAIETIIYLILAILVLTILLAFFFSIERPAQDQFALEGERNRWCGSYTIKDLGCEGSGGNPVQVDPKVLENIRIACTGLGAFGYSYPCGSASLECIQKCCLMCPQK